VNIFKLLVALAVIFLAAFGAFALFGLLFATLKYVLVLGLVVLAAGLGYRALRKKSDDPLVGAGWPERELEKAQRLLEGIRRGQLTK
jgi:membrane protein implicated in regulation of membrane protease activity